MAMKKMMMVIIMALFVTVPFLSTSHALEITYTYDAQNRITMAAYQQGTKTTTLSYQYDAAGNRIAYTVTGIEGPQIQITPSFLNFGYVPPGSHKDLILQVKNIGTGTLTGTVSASPPFSIISGGSYSLGANQTQQVVVRYTAPLEEGAQTGSLTFTGGGGLTVQVTGTNKKNVGLPWLLLLLGN